MAAAKTAVRRYPGNSETSDALAVEEPLEIVLDFVSDGEQVSRTAAITMRTPGDDADLARGFLFTEGIIRAADEIADISQSEDTPNSVQIVLQNHVDVNLQTLERHFYTTSSCGVCGKTSIDALTAVATYAVEESGLRLTPEALLNSPEQVAAAQSTFGQTGSTHAAALFDAEGQLLFLAEDVGRHNALDKLLGRAMAEGLLPLHRHWIFLSGRASFELVQKARMAACPLVAAVGAPSSLAVDLAWEGGMTVVGFLRDGRFNVYSSPFRLVDQTVDQTVDKIAGEVAGN